MQPVQRCCTGCGRAAHDHAAHPAHYCCRRSRIAGLDLPTVGIQKLFEEFQRLGLMFVDEQFVLALAVPAVAGR
jgi:hypothetical protein